MSLKIHLNPRGNRLSTPSGHPRLRLKSLLSLAPLILWCTPPPPLTIESFPKQLAAFLSPDSMCSFKAFGDIKFSIRGVRRAAKIDLLWRSDSAFTLSLYSPLGGAVASVVADSSGIWNITAGDSVLKKHASDKVSVGGLLEYSLTFDEFLRAATGRLLDTTIMRTPSDSLGLSGKKNLLYWPMDSSAGRRFGVTAVVDRKHLSLTDVIYSKDGTELWELKASSIKKGVAEEIRFKDGNNNYFYLKYGTVIVGRGKDCRAERL
jgi:hypothetical protein